MTIQELRQHQILGQDPEINRTQYDAVMNRLRELGEELYQEDFLTPLNLVKCSDDSQVWLSVRNNGPYYWPTLAFDQFMNLEIETE